MRHSRGVRVDELETPCLVVDRDVLDRNVAAMADRARRAGLDLRPHAKTHKCLEIGRLQHRAGAVGLTVATVGEAEVFAEAGADDLFVAYPLWAAGRKGARLRAVAERSRLRVGMDGVEAAALLARALAGTQAEVLVELDSGHHRTGVAPADAGWVAAEAARLGLRVAGVFTFPGHGYGPGAAGPAAADEAAALRAGGAALVAAGVEGRVRSGGSTPTAALADEGTLTELRPGVYVFGDAQQVELGTTAWADVALTAAATVVSRSGRSVVLDAGSKVLGADRPDWTTGRARLADLPAARVTALSEHHATATLPEGDALPELGSVLRVVPNHVCHAVDLADELVVARSGEVVDRWRVAARGRNA